MCLEFNLFLSDPPLGIDGNVLISGIFLFLKNMYHLITSGVMTDI